ncbi:protein-disulfide reductase DsbD domain-containing protein [Algibacter pacificus]|uniref:protein-disulfide reductase DsbD domain-containing protein n=1 Tax=Algibacter pacificus TaxID=2599389 RepID=UPI0011C74256|nr:protein-disulfide reductase DsbD domain-containing protein [Algibacter pacificus]
MKKIILMVSIFVVSLSQAQIVNPVKWETSVLKISDTEADLIATATIDSTWHLYSQIIPEDGPVPTSFTFENNGKFLKKGNTIEEEGHIVSDPVFEMKIKYFENKTSFKQRIKLKSQEVFTVNATVEFMACNDIQCTPPSEVELSFNVN